MSQAAAVLFDMDGVLVDSEPFWYQVEGDLVRRLGGQWDREHQAKCIGGTVDATCRYIVELTGTSWTAAQVQEAVMADMVAACSSPRLTLHDGALELVDAVRARGLRTALVTSSFRVLVDAVLDRIGTHRFDRVVAGDEVSRGKPDPEPYLVACDRLGVAPRDAVVIEDAHNGVVSAEAAGCTVVAVPSIAPIAPQPGRFVVDAIGDIDPDWVVALLARDRLQDV
jgi:HAD superfamily hydrolase (TIGR01509 family)